MPSPQEFSKEELDRFVDSCETLTEEELLGLLRNPFCDQSHIQKVVDKGGALSYHSVQVLLVRHPLTPQHIAFRLVPQLYWKELLDASLDLKTPPVIRRSCEKALIERLPSMGLGEKISLARKATPLVIQALRKEGDTKIIEALLQNPRIRMVVVYAMANDPQTAPEVLQYLGNHSRWSTHYEVRWGLVRNPHTPLGTVLKLIPKLRRPDLRQLYHYPSLHPAAKALVKKLLET